MSVYDIIMAMTAEGEPLGTSFEAIGDQVGEMVRKGEVLKAAELVLDSAGAKREDGRPLDQAYFLSYWIGKGFIPQKDGEANAPAVEVFRAAFCFPGFCQGLEALKEEKREEVRARLEKENMSDWLDLEKVKKGLLDILAEILSKPEWPDGEKEKRWKEFSEDFQRVYGAVLAEMDYSTGAWV